MKKPKGIPKLNETAEKDFLSKVKTGISGLRKSATAVCPKDAPRLFQGAPEVVKQLSPVSSLWKVLKSLRSLAFS